MILNVMYAACGLITALVGAQMRKAPGPKWTPPLIQGLGIATVVVATLDLLTGNNFSG